MTSDSQVRFSIEKKVVMNTEFIVHPKLQHFGLTTANLDAMVDWYSKVLGMTINHRAKVPEIARGRAPFSAAAFISNDEVHHRMVFFEIPGLVADPERARHPRMQHVAFEYKNLDELLGSYVRIKGLGILPVWAAEHGMAVAFYYRDPDQNIVELNVNHYGNEWTATEHMKTASLFTRIYVDPDKMVEARKSGASPWELHERSMGGKLAPDKPFDLGTQF
jgi:catechol 2,3-dioxygenase-like lactoylglutathione lyase family enzyme